LDYLITHTSLSPIWRGFAPVFVNYKKGCTRLAAASDKAYQLLAHGCWFSPGTPASSTTKTGRHDIAEILLKVALNTKNQIKAKQINQKFLKTQCWLFGFLCTVDWHSAKLIFLFNEKCTYIYIISKYNRLYMNLCRIMNIKGINRYVVYICKKGR
jgi:hypothetical protein